MKSNIKKILICLVLFSLSFAVFSQTNSIVNRHYKAVDGNSSLEILFLENNIAILIESEGKSSDYTFLKYVYVKQKNICFMFISDDYDDDYILCTLNDAKGTMTIDFGEELVFSLVK